MAEKRPFSTLILLAKVDPGNAGWQSDLSISQSKIGDVQQAQGDLATALTSYQASHDIFERLAKADPGNARGQSDLALSYGRVAFIQMRRGAHTDALTFEKDGTSSRNLCGDHRITRPFPKTLYGSTPKLAISTNRLSRYHCGL